MDSKSSFLKHFDFHYFEGHASHSSVLNGVVAVPLVAIPTSLPSKHIRTPHEIIMTAHMADPKAA